MNNKHEKPMTGVDAKNALRKNPNNITIRQHILSAKHLSAWSLDNKTVFVKKIGVNDKINRHIAFNDDLFCVMRLWDQGIEKDFKNIEDNFHSQLELILKCKINSKVNFNLLVDYYKSVVIRCILSKRKRPHYVVGNDIAGEHSKKELEISEWRMVDNDSGFISIPVAESVDSQSASRATVRLFVDMMYRKLDEQFANTNWEVCFLEKNHEDFFISDAIDCFYDNEFYLLPLTPRVLLISIKSRDKLGGALNPKAINEIMIRFSKRFCI